MIRRGKCELCHAVAELRDSHFLPKSGYKKTRATDLKNPNPVVLSGGKAKQSSLQVRDHKFCGACEERFNKGGEAWILNNIPQNYGDPFFLHTLLNAKTPIVLGNDLLFSQASIPEVDMAKLVYFALSIFWRGTRHWSEVDGGRPTKLYLGREEKAIRAFLLGRSKLPETVIIKVAVWPFNKVYPIASMPRAERGSGYRVYWFYFFGFIFRLALGKKIPAQERRTCSYHSPERFLTLSPELGTAVKDAIRTQLLSTDRSKIEGMLKEIQAIRSKASELSRSSG
ncbi:MAG: hypothetical protein ACJ71Q_03390 [Terriglobales bacterium]